MIRFICVLALSVITFSCGSHSKSKTAPEIKCPQPPFYSQFGQDRFVYEHFFSDGRPGVFVDVGAYDGISLSNSHFFEKELGWAGICIEPQVPVFRELQRNRDCVCVHGCVAAEAGEKSFLQINPDEELAGPVRQEDARLLCGLIDEYDPRHLDRVNRELDAAGATTRLVDVSCYRLNDLLEENGFVHVDFLSIDTEGGELKILQSIDFDRFSVDVITVENNHHDPEIGEFLASQNFERVATIACDELYCHQRLAHHDSPAQ